jgi:hypothetical protein
MSETSLSFLADAPQCGPGSAGSFLWPSIGRCAPAMRDGYPTMDAYMCSGSHRGREAQRPRCPRHSRDHSALAEWLHASASSGFAAPATGLLATDSPIATGCEFGEADSTVAGRGTSPARADARRDSRCIRQSPWLSSQRITICRYCKSQSARPIVRNLPRYMRYERPAIEDYGTLSDLTEALDVGGPEDALARASRHTASRPATRFRPDLPAVSETK